MPLKNKFKLSKPYFFKFYGSLVGKVESFVEKNWFIHHRSHVLYLVDHVAMLLPHLRQAHWFLLISYPWLLQKKNKLRTWNLIDCKRIRTHNHLARKRTLNHFAKSFNVYNMN